MNNKKEQYEDLSIRLLEIKDEMEQRIENRNLLEWKIMKHIEKLTDYLALLASSDFENAMREEILISNYTGVNKNELESIRRRAEKTKRTR